MRRSDSAPLASTHARQLDSGGSITQCAQLLRLATHLLTALPWSSSIDHCGVAHKSTRNGFCAAVGGQQQQQST